MSHWFIRAAVSIIVAAILLTIIPIEAVLHALGRISVGTWVSSFAIFFAGHYLNAVKLRLILGHASAPLSACVQAQYAGLVANLGLPGLAGGDLVKAAYLIPTAGTKRAAVANIADRLLDTLTLLVLVTIALPLAGVPQGLRDLVPGIGWTIGWLALLGALAGALLVVLLRYPPVASRIGQPWVALRERRASFGAAVAISFCVQSAFVLTNVWLAREVGVVAPTATWFVAWPLSKLIAILPISLGGIGVREAALVSLMAPYGAAKEAVLASGILWQTLFTVGGLIGLFATQWLWPPASAAPLAVPEENT